MGAFSISGKVELVFVEGRMNGTKYQEMLGKYLLTFGPIIGGQNWTFQQDNAPGHSSKSTIGWFQSKNIRVLKWPSRSPDLNPIENLWRLMKDELERETERSIDDSMSKIEEIWERIVPRNLESLIGSMNRRLQKCIDANGAKIDY